MFWGDLTKPIITTLFYFILPPHLTSASALHGKNRKPKIVSFHLNTKCCFADRYTKHIRSITWSQLSHLYSHKSRPYAPNKNLGREHIMLINGVIDVNSSDGRTLSQ